MKTEVVGMLMEATELAKCRSHNWCLSFGFRAVPFPLLPAALAQMMGFPKRDDAGRSQAFLASKLLGWGTVTPHTWLHKWAGSGVCWELLSPQETEALLYGTRLQQIA